MRSKDKTDCIFRWVDKEGSHHIQISRDPDGIIRGAWDLGADHAGSYVFMMPYIQNSDGSYSFVSCLSISDTCIKKGLKSGSFKMIPKYEINEWSQYNGRFSNN